jgi:hypothetical protein
MFAAFLAFMWSPPEMKAQEFIHADTLGVHDSAKVVVVSPYCGNIYIDVFKNGIKNDTLKIYEIPIGCDTGTHPEFRILFCENQASLSSNLLVNDSLLVNLKTHQGTFNTWRILDRNPYALMIVRCNDSGMAGHPTKFILRAEHKWNSMSILKLPDLTLKEKKGLSDYQLWLKQYSRNEITWEELVNLIEGRKELHRYPFFRRLRL